MAAACGGGSDDDASSRPAGSVRRLELEPVNAAAEHPRPRTVRRWVVAEDGLPDGFTVTRADSANVELVPGPSMKEQVPALVVKGPNLADLRFTNHGPGPMQRVLVSVAVLGIADFSLHVSGTGRGMLSAPAKEFRADGAWTTLVFDLPEPVRAGESVREVILRIHNNKDLVAVGSVTTVDRPLATMLPAPGERPQLTAIREFTRPAVGLTPEAPLRTVVAVEGPGLFELYCGVPLFARRDATEPVLVVDLEGDGGTREELRLPLSAGPVDGDPWQLASVPLAPFVGQTLTVTFTVEGTPIAALGPPRLRTPDRSAPTVVLVTSDTHRGDHLGLYPGGAVVKTPFLDSLARRGLYFTNCWTSSNTTNPSHAALMTAMPPSATGVADNSAQLSSRAVTLAEHFRDAGYLTWAAVSVAHLAPDGSGLGQGFDRVYGPLHKHVDSEVTLAAARGWLDEAEGAPLFLWLHVFDAHGPYTAPDEFTRLYWDLDRDDPYDPSLPELGERQKARWDPEIRDVDFIRASYKAEITYLDRQLEGILAHERLSDGVLAFTADHGESLGQHGTWFSHALLYPDTLSVPLILAWPGGPRGEVCDSPVRQIDLGRTLIDLAGLDVESFPGRNLVEIAGAERVDAEPRFAISGNSLSSSVQLERWFLVLHLREFPSPGRTRDIALHEVELYDLEGDPECLENVVATRPEVAAKLRERLVKWLLDAPDERLAERSAAPDTRDLEELAALGYATSATPPNARWFDPDCECKWCVRFE